MTQEENQLQLVDMCARVPYHPKGRVVNGRTGAACEEYLTCATFQLFVNATNNCRLYLRPMSSMTEVEKNIFDVMTRGYTVYQQATLFDWLNKHMFDYRGLIEKDLAIKVTEENNPYKY